LNTVDQTVALNPDTITIVLAVVGIVGVVLGGFALWRVRSISRRFAWVTGGEGGADTLPALLSAVQANQKEIAALESAFAAASIEARTHFKRMGIVRYNAFDGIAGQQSYSLCLLDDNKNGILISNIVGTNSSRSYAVEVKAGEVARPLGDEESQALAAATKNGG
jgi:Protein of unknown function (DUF4446)